eukprot:jgi/Ulvmu1/3573/UM168_0005.1
MLQEHAQAGPARAEDASAECAAALGVPVGPDSDLRASAAATVSTFASHPPAGLPAAAAAAAGDAAARAARPATSPATELPAAVDITRCGVAGGRRHHPLRSCRRPATSPAAELPAADDISSGGGPGCMPHSRGRGGRAHAGGCGRRGITFAQRTCRC